jgi:hypothetical protein
MDKNRYLIELSESLKTDYGKRDFAEQSQEQKVFSAIWELESLVNNGGFQGYFGNAAETAKFAPTALLAIGAQQCAAIVEEALALVPAPPNPMRAGKPCTRFPNPSSRSSSRSTTGSSRIPTT